MDTYPQSKREGFFWKSTVYRSEHKSEMNMMK